VIHDGMQYDSMTRSKDKVKVTIPSKLEIRPFSTAWWRLSIRKLKGLLTYLFRHLQWELATDLWFLN